MAVEGPRKLLQVSGNDQTHARVGFSSLLLWVQHTCKIHSKFQAVQRGTLGEVKRKGAGGNPET